MESGSLKRIRIRNFTKYARNEFQNFWLRYLDKITGTATSRKLHIGKGPSSYINRCMLISPTAHNGRLFGSHCHLWDLFWIIRINCHMVTEWGHNFNTRLLRLIISGFHNVWSWMFTNVSKKHADSIFRVERRVKFYTGAIVSLRQIGCRYYGQSEPREGEKGNTPIPNMNWRRWKKKMLEILVL